MGLLKVSDQRALEEQAVQEKINRAIDDYENSIFSAGAGAGKTYGLIECLRHIILSKGPQMRRHNQKALCITYTNAAANEVKSRLGNSVLVEVSTIHERLWSSIRQFQHELVKIHQEKLEEEVVRLKANLEEDGNDDTQPFRSLTSDQQAMFRSYILNNIDVFYNNYSKNAGEFRKAFGSDLDEFPNIIRNILKFKKTVSTISKIDKYETCLSKIKTQSTKIKQVKYEATFNRDALHRMIISHDTLLEYSCKLTEKFELFKQLWVDSYPFILVDEYQDTNPLVVNLLRLLDQYSDKRKKNLFIGYFGDVSQSIYDQGIGDKINEAHPGLKLIEKKFNRRSHKEIIDAINAIRNDAIEQESIYADSEGGTVEFLTGSIEDVVSFVSNTHQEWKVNSPDKKTHCFVLTNRLVAELSGFPDVYATFAATDFYVRHYDSINTELLSTDSSKLGRIPKLLFNLLEFEALTNSAQTKLSRLVDDHTIRQLPYSRLQSLVRTLKNIRGDKLQKYIVALFTEYKRSDEQATFQRIIRKIFGQSLESYQEFFDLAFQYLFSNIDNDDNEQLIEAKNTLDRIFDISLDQFRLWFQFVSDAQQGDIEYHTYHATKGRQFHNVVVVMQNDFGNRNRRKFSNFFKHVAKEDTPSTPDEEARLQNTRNLLYVSCSRAITRLRILYIDDIAEFAEGITKIFGTTRSLHHTDDNQ